MSLNSLQKRISDRIKREGIDILPFLLLQINISEYLEINKIKKWLTFFAECVIINITKRDIGRMGYHDKLRIIERKI